MPPPSITSNSGPMANGTRPMHPNGQHIMGNLKRPVDERKADYSRILEESVDPEDYLGQVLKSLLLQYLIKQEHRMGWAIRSACDDTTLHSHPNETVGSHQWGVSFLVMVLARTKQFQDELPNFDCLKAIEMALLHDVPEAKVGDITPKDGISPEVKHQLEKEALEEMLSIMPEPLKSSLHNVYSSYEDRQCAESKFVKDCDKLDFIITAFLLERQGFTGFPEFYTNSMREGFSTKIAKELAETLIRKRKELSEKQLLYY